MEKRYERRLKDEKKKLEVASNKKAKIEKLQEIVNKSPSVKNYLIGIQNVEDLPEAIKESETFEPNEYKNNNQKMLNIIEDFIEKV